MSAELETLDQLLAGGMPLAVIRTVYPNAACFVRGMTGLLAGGDVRLLANGVVVPSWRWHEVLTGASDGLRVEITDAGAARVT